jgi:hypothetical protein
MGDHDPRAPGDAADPRPEPLDPLAEVQRLISPSDQVCGNCLLWRPTHQDLYDRWVGPCRVQSGRGDLAATAPVCDRFLPRGSRVPQAPPPEPGRRRAVTLVGPTRRRPGAAAVPAPATRSLPVVPRPDVELGEIFDMTRNELIDVLREALGEATAEGPLPPLAGKWDGGAIVLRPGNPELQPKEIPLDALFHKVVMIRDRLRVLEAKLNAHAKLSDADKVELQGYITKCYGSLTTFNVLFREKGDQFVGERGKDE